MTSAATAGGDAKKAARIAARTKGTGAESAARMGLEALRVSRADCALMAVPGTGENPAFALVVTPKVAWVRLMAKDDPAARNWLLDMAAAWRSGCPRCPVPALYAGQNCPGAAALPAAAHPAPGKSRPRHPRRLCRRMPPEREETTAPETKGAEEPAALPVPKHRSRNPPRPRKGSGRRPTPRPLRENAQPGSPQEERLRAALRLYGEEEEELPAPYAAPKKSYRGRLAVCLAAVLVLCALAAGIAWWRANSGQGPSPRGTAP